MTTSLLATDGYKFSMAEAGWPLRKETFYYSHRKGGWQILPLDVERWIADLWPTPVAADFDYLDSVGYGLGPGARTALGSRDQIRVHALPKGTWFLPREPVVSVTGPSALVSWIEPMLLQLNYRIQVATMALTSPDDLPSVLGSVTCDEQLRVVQETLDSVGVRFPAEVHVDEDGYRARVRTTARELVEIVGDPGRIFEVGMRSVTCPQQHRIALEACRDAGITRTSNVFLASEMGLTPVGTMGHEHVQRFGSDASAFRAMRERRPGRASFLLDTFDTLRSGLPAAFGLMKSHGVPGDSIRYDSGDKEAQYRAAVTGARQFGLDPVHILEDGFDAPQTRRFEELRRELGIAAVHQLYGYGGQLVAAPAGSPLTRDRVSAVWKVSQTGPDSTMKFGDEVGAGKQSLPGRPVVWRRVSGAGPEGLIGQAEEPVPAGYAVLTGSRVAGAMASVPTTAAQAPLPGPATRALIDGLTSRRSGSADRGL